MEMISIHVRMFLIIQSSLSKSILDNQKYIYIYICKNSSQSFYLLVKQNLEIIYSWS